jgi:5-methylcytosine-specific restriction endonuclease McrBC GTP-binding regulatory subunit McrB
MNTADRSIARVDAAIRRRFYFVPFFPDKPPIEGLLRRWLSANRLEMLWLADLLDEANKRLLDYDSRHGAIGPSHFMLGTPAELDEKRAALIWEYGVLPTIEETLFEHEEDLPRFTLDALKAAASPTTGVDDSVVATESVDDA